MEYPITFSNQNQVVVTTDNWNSVKAQSLVFYLPESEVAPTNITNNIYLDRLIGQLYTNKSFTGKSETTVSIPCYEVADYQTVVLVGVGSLDSFDSEKQRRIGAVAAKKVKELKSTSACAVLALEGDLVEMVREISVGWLLALYSFNDFKSAVKESSNLQLTFANTNKEFGDIATNFATAVVQGVNLARDLVNLPPNYCNAEFLADTALKIGQETGLKVTILDKAEIEKEKMNAYLAVNLGSSVPPKFIVIEHDGSNGDANAQTTVFVGKAVTFDTGGYNIKNGDGMASMKTDMAGGAAVLGTMLTVGLLKPATKVVALIPATDNRISDKSYLPQDVITASNGKTIEILSTDAEGRMTLADALVYAERFKPDFVVDIATLTGACVSALGGVAAGMFTNDDDLKELLLDSAKETNEKLWQMPLFEEYNKMIESTIADLKNTGGVMGGLGSSAMFLKNFVNYKWAHIDMAGVVGDATEKPYNVAKNPSGYGVRLFVEMVCKSKK